MRVQTQYLCQQINNKSLNTKLPQINIPPTMIRNYSFDYQ